MKESLEFFYLGKFNLRQKWNYGVFLFHSRILSMEAYSIICFILYLNLIDLFLSTS